MGGESPAGLEEERAREFFLNFLNTHHPAPASLGATLGMRTPARSAAEPALSRVKQPTGRSHSHLSCLPCHKRSQKLFPKRQILAGPVLNQRPVSLARESFNQG